MLFQLTFIENMSNNSYKYHLATIVEPGIYFKKYVQCLNCTNFKGSNLENGPRNDQNVKISNWVSMRLFKEFQVPVSWIWHTK